MQIRTRRLIPTAAGAIAALAISVSALGYAGEVVQTMQVTGPAGRSACGTALAVHAVILNAESAPVADHAVAWTLGKGAVPADSLVDAATTSNAEGVATTSLKLACGGDNRTVTVLATADDIVGQITVTVAESTTGLPRADALTAGDGPSLPSVLLAGLAVIAAVGVVLRRFASERG